MVDKYSTVTATFDASEFTEKFAFALWVLSILLSFIGGATLTNIGMRNDEHRTTAFGAITLTLYLLVSICLIYCVVKLYKYIKTRKK